MSGIAGIYRRSEAGGIETDLGRMLSALSRRGPDGVDTWTRGGVGLGHRLLHTTPESLHEAQPLVSARSAAVLTADARIDNRTELISALRLSASRTITDADIILAAYDEWGDACAERLLGDFAFAIWDAQRERVFCARDHMGVKPLYYYFSPGSQFVFASEPKGVWTASGVPYVVNESHLANHLASIIADTESTAYRDIQRLPPAHTLVVDRSGLRISRYWELDPEREIRYASVDEYAEAFQSLFTEAVRCRLRSAFPVGSHLSGGLDSSSVTAVARNILADEGRGPLHTLSFTFSETTQCDERSYIDAVLEQGGLVPHFIDGDETGPLSSWRETMAYEDEPFRPGAHYLSWRTAEMARDNGLRVMLDGIDGDTTVWNGFEYMTELGQEGRWQDFYKEAHDLSVRQRGHHFPNQLWRSYGAGPLERLARRGRWIHFLRQANEIGPLFGIRRMELIRRHGVAAVANALGSRLGKGKQDAVSTSLVADELSERLDMARRVRSFTSDFADAPSSRIGQWKMLTVGIIPLSMEGYDRLASSFSIEHRHPFMDRRLIEFCLALPGDLKLRAGWERFILRRALRGILPEAVRRRAVKTNLVPSFVRAAQTFDRSFADGVLSSDLSDVAHVVDTDRVRAAHERVLSNDTLGDGVSAGALWKGTNTILWLRRFQERRALPLLENQSCAEVAQRGQVAIAAAV